MARKLKITENEKNMSYGILCENCAAVCGSMGDEERQKNYAQKAREVMGRLQ